MIYVDVTFNLHLVHKHTMKCFISVKDVSEEYKLSILECMISLCKSLSWDVVQNIYTKNNAPKLCKMLYVALEMAKKENFRKLRYEQNSLG